MTEVNHRAAEVEADTTEIAWTGARAAEEMRQAGWSVEYEVTTRAGGGAVGIASSEAAGKVRLTWYPKFTKQARYPLYAAVIVEDSEERAAFVRGRCPTPEEVPELVTRRSQEYEGVVLDPDGIVELD